MPCYHVRFGNMPAIITVAGEYKPGDMPPEGYIEWHEWASVQHKAGLRQRCCPDCGKWRYPQELSDQTREWNPVDSKGRVYKQIGVICKACAALSTATKKRKGGA